MDFTSLEQRMAHSYLDTLPPFFPAKDGPPQAAQRAFYDLMAALYKLAYNEPLLFVPQLHEDDAFPNRFSKKSYGKPELRQDMYKFIKAMDALLQSMFLLAADPAAAKLNARQRTILARLGIKEGAPLPEAWVWMATRPGASLAAFSHCAFDAAHGYPADIHARLLGNEAAFRRLEGWMLQQGYKRYDSLKVTSCDDFTLCYANPAWSTETPSGDSLSKVKHTGIACRYDSWHRQPAVLGLCIPGGMRRNLELFGEMDPALQGFVVQRTKHCDACRYCVQTDKTGKRPLASIPVNFEGETHSLCTYFPGYNYCWTALDDELVDRLIAFLGFMDAHRPA